MTAPASRSGRNPTSREHLLKVRGITVEFGGVRAVDDLTLEVDRGEVVGLIGPNGAGKTSALNAIGGSVRVRSGTIHFKGVDITNVPVRRRPFLGIARTFQGVELFPTLTVMENLLLGRHHAMRSGVIAAGLYLGRTRREERIHRARASEVAARLGIESVLDELVGELPFGMQKYVGIGRAICAEPELLLLDEPASGLTQPERERLTLLLRELMQEMGAGILWVEHDVPMVRQLAGRAIALHLGSVLAEGAPDDVLSRPQVRAAFLGIQADTASTGVDDDR